MIRTKFFNTILITASALALASCGGSNGPDSSNVVLHRGNNAEPLSLDPHKASGTWENNIIGDMFLGLFTDDPDGAPIPGMAESWEVSEDGLTWTFTLREAYWSDGEPVTAGDFVFAWQRIATPATGAQYVSLLYPIVGVEEASTGAADPSSIGVRAIDDRTLEVHLVNPAPYLQGLLTHYTTFPLPQHVVEVYGDEWVRPANMVSNGAYTLEDWRTNNYVHLTRNANFYDNANVCIDDVYYYPTVDNSAAGRRVRNGELDLNMEFPGQQMEFLRREIPDFVRVNPFMGTIYFSINTTIEQFDDVNVRNALGMAIDRDFIANEILRAGQQPAYSMIPPGVANYPGGVEAEWADIPVEQRRANARALLEAAGYGPDNPFEFEYTYRATGDNPRIAPVVQNDWSAIADWVQPELIVNDTQIHYDNLRASDFQVADGGWIADYNDPYNFLFLGEYRSVPMNYARYNNPEFDALVTEANRELDLELRGEMMAEAEQILIDDMPIIPLVFYVNKSLVNPRVTGWEDNLTNIHRTRYLCFADLEESDSAAE
ncbi:peptide ABC transporter substrate-binding protein [Maricaulis sp. W15]|uniref:Oligopeptide transport system substrate-binding protein n=1 Tax=Maricaulis maris TaxID=74318 RepID=A0A495D100_9PROT|nr:MULTISPECIES: peptide ABC transporter substrate-binding protein [Maricaulis]OLF72343.1 peptide ABC transporter substrate-binding protein [Maricaulis sp. W15]RKQ95184.1 oligopeptide transport system substrate-binding protein [Maricaulis maris]